MKKNGLMQILFRLSCVLFLFLLPVFPQSETIRDRASVHFDLVRWTSSAQSSSSAQDTGLIPGGTETFAVLGADRDSGVPAIYPSIPELGTLDYSGLDQGLLDLLSKFSGALAKRNIDMSFCHPKRPFIPVIANYQLERLPDPDICFYSRPVADESGLYDILFLLRFPSGKANDIAGNKDDLSRSLLAYVKAGLAQGNWYVCEMYFDGEAYAELSRKN